MNDQEPIGYALLISKKWRDEINAFFEKQDMQFGARQFGFEHEGKNLHFIYPCTGMMMDCRFSTKEEALEALSNIQLFGLTRADLGSRIPKYQTEIVSDGTLAKINPEWEDAPWSIEMAFVPDKKIDSQMEWKGNALWINKSNP